MNITYEQTELLRRITQGVESRAEKSALVDEMLRRSKREQLKSTDYRIALQVKEALAAGIPKAQVNAALGSKNSGAWDAALKRGGVEL